jgi:enamine deaminase RidA (YjgF/YER057c/UK114 family)
LTQKLREFQDAVFLALRSRRINNMPARQNISGSSPFEPVIGFSRAVRIGNTVHVSGTGPVGADQGSVEEQTRQVFRIIGQALHGAGASLSDVVRTRMYLTRAADWEIVGKVHGELFAAVRPAATMVVVAALLNPSWRIEIEVEATLDRAEG